MAVGLTALRPEDEPWLRTWTRAFLRDHLRRWVAAYGLGWSEAAIDGHILAHDLAEKDWQRLAQAARQWEDNLVVVAREGGTPVGAVWAESAVHPFLQVRMGVLAWIYVTPDARGSGVGRALVDAALDWMRAKDLPAAELHVIADNATAVRLYERAGWGVVDLKMGRSLRPS